MNPVEKEFPGGGFNSGGSVIYRAAVIYASHFKFSVFPCRTKSKAPLTAHGCKDELKTSVKLRSGRLNGRTRILALLVAHHRAVFVLDIDGDEGQESLKKFESTHGPLPKTPLSLTGKGQQFFFKTTATVKNRVRLAPGVDIRTDGGYVIAPPSIHPNGRRYAWEVSARIDEIAIADAPAWLIELATGSGDGSAITKDWSDLTSGEAPVGSRNTTLASLAGHLFRRYVDPKVAYMLLKAWNRSCTQRPLSDSEFDRTVNSIATAEAARRAREGQL